MSFTIYIDSPFRSPMKTSNNNSIRTPYNTPQRFIAATPYITPSSRVSAAIPIPATPHRPVSVRLNFSAESPASPDRSKWQGRPMQEAFSPLNHHLASHPNDAKARLERGKIFIKQENWDRAIEDLSLAGTSREAGEMLGAAYHEKGNAELNNRMFVNAIHFFTKSIDVRPNCPATWAQRGSAYHAVGNPESAEYNFNQALSLDENFIPALSGMGMVAEKQGRFDVAMEYYEKAYVLNKEVGNLLINAYESKALAYIQKKEFDSAVALLRLCFTISKDRIFTYVLLGNVYLVKTEFSQAINYFDTAIKLNGNNPLALTGKGEALLKQNRLDEAFPLLEKAYQIDPHDDYVKSVLNQALLLKAEGRQKRNDWSGAANYYTQSLKIYPNDPGTLSDRGVLYYKLGYYSIAVNEFEVALRLNQNHHQSLAYLGAALHKVGKYAYSIKTLNQADKLKPNDPFVLKQIDEAYRQLGLHLRTFR